MLAFFMIIKDGALKRKDQAHECCGWGEVTYRAANLLMSNPYSFSYLNLERVIQGNRIGSVESG